jgi:hypothetical protein
MPRFRVILALFLAPSLLAGCGTDGGDSTSTNTGKASGSAKQESPTRPADGASSTNRATVSAGSFADTPELERCLTTAGFAKDAPPTGGLAAWRGPDGARAVVGSGTDVTAGIASEIGAADRPAHVKGTVVIAGPAAPAKAAASCLADVAG